MWPFKKKEKQRKKTAARHFNAADISRLVNSWRISNTSIDRDLRSQLPILRARSRELWANNEYAKRFVMQAKTNIVGAKGITLQNRAKFAGGELDRAANTAIEAAWRDWSKRGQCDVTTKLSRVDIERLIIETVIRDGEILIRRYPRYDNKFQYALQLIEADHLDHRLNEERSDGSAIRMGVELDTWGKPVRYHLHRKHPGDLQTNTLSDHDVVDAGDIVHIFVPMRAHQTRGIPWMHAAMIALWDVGGYREAAIVAARVGASKMGFFSSPTGEGYTGDDTDSAGNTITEAEPGTFDQLPSDTSLETWDPTYPHDQFAEFNKAMLRGIAGALGVAYHSFANDLEGVNFSSSRAGILEERDTWMCLQEWLAESFHDQVFPEWLQISLLLGNIRFTSGIPLPASKYDKFNAPTWQGRRWPWVDPLKDIQANREAISARVRSISSVIRETGSDPDDVFEEIQAEREKLTEMGIPLDADTGTAEMPDSSEESTEETSDAETEKA